MFVLVIIIIISLALAIPAFVKEVGTKATINDIDTRTDGIYIIVTAKYDIDDLKIRITIRDRKNVIIDRFTDNLGDVEAGESYRIDYNYTNLITGAWEYELEVISGRKKT